AVPPSVTPVAGAGGAAVAIARGPTAGTRGTTEATGSAAQVGARCEPAEAWAKAAGVRKTAQVSHWRRTQMGQTAEAAHGRRRKKRERGIWRDRGSGEQCARGQGQNSFSQHRLSPSFGFSCATGWLRAHRSQRRRVAWR